MCGRRSGMRVCIQWLSPAHGMCQLNSIALSPIHDNQAPEAIHARGLARIDQDGGVGRFDHGRSTDGVVGTQSATLEDRRGLSAAAKEDLALAFASGRSGSLASFIELAEGGENGRR